jgi:hypothetical protein
MTLALHVAPGDVTATSVALAPCLTDAGRLVMRTDREAAGEALGSLLATGVADGSEVGVLGASGMS